MQLAATSTDADPTDASGPVRHPSDRAQRPLQDRETPLTLGRTMVLGLVATTAITAGAVLGGRSFETHLPGAWFFGMPGGLLGSVGSSDQLPPVASLALVYGGLIVLTRVWLGLLGLLRDHPGFPVRRVVLVAVVWALPLLVAPPLFSRDVYTYAAQGEMMSHHISPYAYGPGVLGATPFNQMADSTWSNAESPYGPLFLGLDGKLDQASGHEILGDLVLLRLLAVAGLALVVAGTPTLARALRHDPAHAVLLGAGSPLALLMLAGGDHNDALMAGLLVAGLAVARRVGTVPGVVLCALAASVKSPALLGVVFLGWVWPGPDAALRRRIGHTLGALLVALGTMEVVSLVTGAGWGWLRSGTTADSAFTGITPINLVARGLSGLSHAVFVPVPILAIRPILIVLGLLAAAVVGYRQLMRSPHDGVVRCLGITLLVLALLSPVVWAWYLTWGVLVLAPAAVGRLRTVVIAVSTFWVFAGVTALHGAFFSLVGTSPVSDALLLAMLLAVGIMPLAQFAPPGGRARLPHLGAGVLAGTGAPA